MVGIVAEKLELCGRQHGDVGVKLWRKEKMCLEVRFLAPRCESRGEQG